MGLKSFTENVSYNYYIFPLKTLDAIIIEYSHHIEPRCWNDWIKLKLINWFSYTDSSQIKIGR
jgi:hypothetical protein